MHWIDPAHLPETHGTLERFLLDPRGHIDGFLLREGTEVHVPPHLSSALHALVKPGDTVSVRGVRPRGVDMISAVQIRGASSEAVTDDGPPSSKDGRGPKDAPRPAREARTVVGTVARLLHGPRGEVRGAMLDDGTLLRWSPHGSGWVDELARPSASLHARGEGLSTPEGCVVEVRAIGTSPESLRELAPPPKPGHDGPPKPGHEPPKPPKHSPPGHEPRPAPGGPAAHAPPKHGPPGHKPKPGAGEPGVKS